MKFSDERNGKQNIAAHCKEICGEKVEYKLCRLSENRYEISVSKGELVESATFACDFFDAATLLRVIEDTDTLPENISEIAEDYSNR